jgi:hypothetical protein
MLCFLLLKFYLPQTVEIAISVNCDRLLICQGKGYLRLLAGGQIFALTAAVGLQVYPSDAVLLGHGVKNGANHYLNGVALYLCHGDVLFTAGLYYTGLQLGHLLTAAYHGNARIMNETHDITAMLTNVKLAH